VIVGFTAPRRSRKYFGALVIALRDGPQWRYVGHVGTDFSHAMLEELHAKLWPLRTDKSAFQQRVKDEAVTTGSSRSWSPRSNLPSGPQSAKCATRRSSACAKTRTPKT
jgi:bifunctional non-homologous end joining protein LigD